jgi:hypothetical protein
MKTIAAFLATALLQVPPPPQGSINRQAIERSFAEMVLATINDPAFEPIPLTEDGSKRYGVLLDRFLMARETARVAVKKGEPLTPESFLQLGMGYGPLEVAVIAYPLTCDGQIVAPTEIDLSISSSGPVQGPMRRIGDVLKTTSAIEARMPGVKAPPGAIAQVFANSPLQSSTVRITYSGPACPATEPSLLFRFRMTGATSTGRPMQTAKLPPEASSIPWPVTVRVQGLPEANGGFRFPTAIDGPKELAGAAIELAKTFRFQPFRMNGVPIAQTVSVPITFTGDGAPTAMPPPGAPSSGSPLNPIASSSVGGQIPTMGSEDAPGLTLATSKCPVSDDPAYGTTPAKAIKVDGGVRGGPARERAYLGALRGPAGQGLRYRRLGSAQGPDGDTILDIYEVTYAGISAPVRLYLDEYHWEDLKAPAGFACPAAIALSKVGG